jgi:hypothetical protein
VLITITERTTQDEIVDAYYKEMRRSNSPEEIHALIEEKTEAIRTMLSLRKPNEILFK